MLIEGIPLEAFYCLREAVRKVPGRRPGKTVSRATLERWRLYGLRGIRLQCTRIGHDWYTCDVWLAAFLERLNPAKSDPPKAVPVVRSGGQRRRAAEQARQRLEQHWSR